MRARARAHTPTHPRTHTHTHARAHQGYQDIDGREIRDRRLIARNYVRTWLVLDITSGIPFDLIEIIAYHAESKACVR